jgi:hypothetical protein
VLEMNSCAIILAALHDAGPGGCEAVVWVLLATLLSDVLKRPQWLLVWDHLVAAPPQHLQRMAAALLITARMRLLAARGARSRLMLLRKPMSVDVQQVCTRHTGSRACPCHTMHCLKIVSCTSVRLQMVKLAARLELLYMH